MKKFIAVFVITFCSFHRCAYADFYRATGGGVYELYVNDCSKSGMRRALDNATREKHAVITTVKCVKDYQYNTQQSQYDFNHLSTVEFCDPCNCVFNF